MMSNVDGITKMLTILLICMCAILVILLFVFILVKVKDIKNKKAQEKNKLDNDGKKKNAQSKDVKAYKEYTKNSIFDFMKFKKIEDNMILKDNGTYLMVIECQGVNYDLMSELEKVSVEQGFMQFLNSLRFPIQIYVQTRTVNLQSSINGYKNKLTPIENKYNMMQMQYMDMQKKGTHTPKEMQQAYYNLVKQKNLYEYTKDIIMDTERMSLNHNVLNKKYYIIISYDEPEAENGNYSKEEIQSMAFSELYTRAQSIIRTIISCEITSRILSSEELAELLYNAYNREEADVMSIERAFRSGYEDLYSTAPDVLDKKMQLLNKKIEEEAQDLANKKVFEARTEKEIELAQKEESIADLISDLAQELIKENARYIDGDVAENAINKIQREKEYSKGGNEDEKEKTTTRRGRPRRNQN